MQNDTTRTKIKSNSKPEVGFQYEAIRFPKTESSFISAVDWDTLSIEIWYASSLPPSYTSAVIKPEPEGRFPTL